MYDYKNINYYSYRKLFVGAALLIVALFCWQPVKASSLAVLDARVGQNGNISRIVFETSGATSPKAFTLGNPPRLVLDFPTLEVKKKLSKVKLPTGSIIKSMRDGIFNNRTHRIVIDLKNPVAYKKFTISADSENNHRVVIDVKQDKSYTKSISKIDMIARELERKPTPKPRVAKKDFVIVIDPGHGGIDPGAIGKQKTREKDVVLAVARKLSTALNKEPGIKARLTRNNDSFLKLQERVNKAKALKADLFISLHADAHDSRKVRGGTVYVLSENASDREAQRLASLANRGFSPIDAANETASDTDVRDILIDLAQRDTMNNSALLARSLINNMDKKIHMRSTDIKFAGFKVLKAPDVPSVLVEMAYLSNAHEEKKLRTSAHQRALANVIKDGLLDYLKTQR